MYPGARVCAHTRAPNPKPTHRSPNPLTQMLDIHFLLCAQSSCIYLYAHLYPISIYTIPFVLYLLIYVHTRTIDSTFHSHMYMSILTYTSSAYNVSKLGARAGCGSKCDREGTMRRGDSERGNKEKRGERRHGEKKIQFVMQYNTHMVRSVFNSHVQYPLLSKVVQFIYSGSLVLVKPGEPKWF